MNGNHVNKNAYYLDFTIEKFLAGKELLKSMPMLFNRVYFCKKYANALWNGDTDESVHFKNIALLANLDDMMSMRQIIKNNFLYKSEWDSLKFTNEEDFGFSFIAGNIKYIIMPFDERENGYEIRSYDVLTGMCTTTDFKTDKKFFLDSSINANGEFVRTCAFDEEDINEENSKSKLAEKKVGTEMAVYGDNRGFAISKANYIVAFMILVLVIVWVLYAFMKISQLA